MGKNQKPKEITILIPKTQTWMTLSITKKPDGRNLVCKFTSYDNARILMTWANRRLGDRFNFLKALEEASLAAVMADHIDLTEFSMDFNTETLHRLIKKAKTISSTKKPVRNFKNLFGLLKSHQKDGYNLSEDDFSTDTSDDEYYSDEFVEDGLIENLRKLKLAKNENYASTKTESFSNSTSVVSQLVNSPTQAEIDLQKAILTSHQDEEKLTIPIPRSSPQKIKPKSNSNLDIPSSTISSSISIGHFSSINVPADSNEDAKIEKPAINQTNKKSVRFG